MSLRTFVAALVAAAAMMTAACGGSASISPTAPTSVAGASGTAVITGQVSGVTTATAAVSTQQSLNATKPVTVTVVGTGISTSVDGTGRFTLTGVPAGDVQLKIEGNGANAVVTISGVSPSDRIEITVSVSGSSAHVDSEHRGKDDGADHDANDDDATHDAQETELNGLVAGLTGACPAVTFTINTTTVKTSATTRFANDSCGLLSNGRRVEVKGARQADGSIAATKVEVAHN